MAPSRFASLRGRSNSGAQPPPPHPRHTSSSSADDSALQLVAFRYEQTIQAEPPIPILPIPPPRNPLRLQRPVTAKSSSTATTRPASIQYQHQSQHQSQNQSQNQNQHQNQNQNQNQRQHQRQSQSESTCSSQHSPSSSTTSTDWRRGTVSSASTTLPDDLDQDDSCTRVTFDPEGHPSSVYSTDAGAEAEADGQGDQSTVHSGSVPRISCQSRWSLSESDTSDTDSYREKNSTRRLIRGLSLRLAPPTKRRKRPSPGLAGIEAMRAATAAMAPISASPLSPPHSTLQSVQSHHSRQSQSQSQSLHHLQGSPAPHSSLSPDLAGPSSQEIGHNDSQSPIPRVPGPLSEEARHAYHAHHAHAHDHAHDHDESPPSELAPTISTDIPQGDFFDHEFLDNLQFSKRGSVYLGGKRAISAPRPPPHDLSLMDKFVEPRPAPAAPVSPTHRATGSKPTIVLDRAKNPSLPDIRVLPDDTERESQKVRSLYESTDLIHWQDGAPGRHSGEPLESPDEIPSDGGDNIAGTRPRDNRRSVRALYLSPTSLLSVTSLPSPRGNARRNEFELAGGIEDWEDVQGEDVDRYGFITVGGERPLSSTSIPAETRSLYVATGRRNGRKVLTKRSRGPPVSQGIFRVPSRKISARSLNTQASGLSTSSRISVRSGIRAAANMLPHNRDRRIVDAAGDMLSLPPGLAETDEDQRSAQAIRLAQAKEARRSEKWRKMAKIVTQGKDGKGVRFVANNMKKELGIKFETEDLAKGAGREPKHVEIQSVEIMFDNTNPKLIERTWKGIPDRWRSSAWYSFLSSSAKSANCEVTEQELFAKFHALQEFSSPDDVQIDLDVPRTINRHIMFRKRYRGGQRLLFRVLHAMSLYFPDTGYVQGMAALAASLLCYYDEERCFVMLVRLWQFRGLQRLYQEGFAGLLLALKDLENYWLRGKPIFQKLNDLGIDPTAYGTRWYLTLFNLSIPFPVQLRIWDVFMLLGGSAATHPSSSGKAKEKEKPTETDADSKFEGLDILHATAAALIDMHKDVIIGGDFENVMKGLTSFQEVKDEDKFMTLVRAEWNMRRGRRKG